jgi:hypothetical protein
MRILFGVALVGTVDRLQPVAARDAAAADHWMNSRRETVMATSGLGLTMNWG